MVFMRFPPPPGHTLGRCLGTGSFGAVYLAVEQSSGRSVAVKFLKGSDPGLRARFGREARILSQLDHPNLSAAYDFELGTEYPYLISEYVEGEDLKARLERETILPSERVVTLAAQILEGLNHAHSSGVVHRDLKPANILIDSAGTVKIVDFGLATARDIEASLTRTGTILGSPAYMAPEQALDSRVSHQVDLYALGIILYELLCGTKPFVHANPLQVLMMHQGEEPTSLKSLVPDVDPRLHQLILRCMEKKVENRLQSAQDGLDLLENRRTRSRPWAKAEKTQVSKSIRGDQTFIKKVADLPRSVASFAAREMSPSLVNGLIFVSGFACAWILKPTGPGHSVLTTPPRDERTVNLAAQPSASPFAPVQTASLPTLTQFATPTPDPGPEPVDEAVGESTRPGADGSPRTTPHSQNLPPPLQTPLPSPQTRPPSPHANPTAPEPESSTDPAGPSNPPPPLPQERIVRGSKDRISLALVEALRTTTPDTILRLEQGRYRAPGHLSQSIQIEGPDKGEAVLVLDGGASMNIPGLKVSIRNVTIQAQSGNSGAILEVSGHLQLNSITIQLDRQSGIHARGAESRLDIDGVSIEHAGDLRAPEPTTTLAGLIVEKQVTGLIKDLTVQGVRSHGVIVREGSTAAFQGLQVIDCGGLGVHIERGAKPSFLDCQFLRQVGAHVQIDEAADPDFKNCTLADGEGVGVLVGLRGSGTFDNCQITGNAGPGVVLQTQAHPRFKGCRIQGNEGPGIRVESHAGGRIEDCDLLGNRGESWATSFPNYVQLENNRQVTQLTNVVDLKGHPESDGYSIPPDALPAGTDLPPGVSR